jgi:hypothetical protein
MPGAFQRKLQLFACRLMNVSRLLILCAVLSACSVPNILPTANLTQPTELQSSPIAEVSTPTLAELVESGSPVQTTATSQAPDAEQDLPAPIHYTIWAEFNYTYQTLNVLETIEYNNRTGENLSSIQLTIEPARLPDTFRLGQVTWENGAPAEFTLNFQRMEIPLEKPLEPGQSIVIHIQYELDLPEITDPETENDRPFAFGYTERQSNLVDWYPMVPPYKPGSGWMIHNPWYFGEHVVYEKSDFDVVIQTKDAPQSLVIAASAPVEMAGSDYHYSLKNARSFAWSAGAEYQVLTQNVGDVTISSYYFPFNPAAGEQVLKDTAAAVELYNRIYGPYPHKTLAVVEADFLDGMEYDGLYFLSRGFYNLYQGTPDGYLTAIAVHETAHQWWYGIVSNDQAIEPWLDESFCTYSEYLFYENTYPDLTDWWWSFRVYFYSPTGYVNGQIYDYSGFRPYVNAVYLRGARLFHELRSEMGDEEFFAFLKDYSIKNAGRIVTRSDFMNELELYTERDLSTLFDNYFEIP